MLWNIYKIFQYALQMICAYLDIILSTALRFMWNMDSLNFALDLYVIDYK